MGIPGPEWGSPQGSAPQTSTHRGAECYSMGPPGGWEDQAQAGKEGEGPGVGDAQGRRRSGREGEIYV